ncbi:hypothetical protein AgCh_038732 [Apium graveolens]
MDESEVNSDWIDSEEEFNSPEEESSQQPQGEINSTVKECVDWNHYKTKDGYDFWIPNCDERYNMVFVPFTGVDNHWNNVTFDAALLEKEDYTNFQWVIQAFEKAMGGKRPKCAITDQCPAISKALGLTWETTPHRLCMWHIMNKLSYKIGPSLASDKKFMTSLKSIVYADHLSENEFEEGWTKVMEEYKLQDNTWLQEMYAIRTDWIPYFHRRGSTLVEFYSRFESALKKQRYNNAQSNKDSQLIPKPHTPLAIEKDAANVYTRNLFNFVSGEIKNALHFTKIDDMVNFNGIKSLMVNDKLLQDHIFEVSITLSNNDVHCSCKFYDRVGYLCRHAFAALIQCDAVEIPRQLVMSRWIKDVESVHEVLSSDEVLQHCAKIDRIKVKVNELNFEFQSCISYVGVDEEKIDKMCGHVKLMKEDVQDLDNGPSKKLSENVIDFLIGTTPRSEVVIHNPNINRNKGCGSRLKSGKEAAMNGSSEKRRKCSNCGKTEGHNARSCPLNKN